MKKLFAKMLCVTLTFVLLLGITVPVQAVQLNDLVELAPPASFDFSMEIDYSQVYYGDVPRYMQSGMNDVWANGISVGVNGTVVSDGLAASVYVEVDIDLEQILRNSYQDMLPMLGSLNVDLSEPFRFWLEADLNDFNNPECVMVIEIPTFFRMMLMFADAGLTSQYWVIDLSEEIAAELVGAEAEINDFLSDYTLEELMAEAIADIQAEVIPGIMDLLAELQEEANNLDYGFNIADNGAISAFIRFGITNTYDSYTYGSPTSSYYTTGYSSEAAFAFSGEITNINNTEKVPMPQLTPQNSLDLVAWLESNW